MPSTVTGLCLALVGGLVGRRLELPEHLRQAWEFALRIAIGCVDEQCTSSGRSKASAPEPDLADTAYKEACPEPIIVRRPLEGLSAHRQFVHDLSAVDSWYPECLLAGVILVLLIIGCLSGFCCRRCLELPVSPVKYGGGSARAPTGSLDRRALRR